MSSRHTRNLEFSNPGRFMEDFDPEHSQREMRKVQRRYCRDSRYGNKVRIYNDRGIRMYDNRDVCDCLQVQCPGCHMPCPRCSSCKCGADCRKNRAWFYIELETDGNPRKKLKNDLLREESMDTSQYAALETKFY